MSTKRTTSNSVTKTKARWFDNRSYRGIAIACGASLLLGTIVAVHECVMFVMRVRSIEKNLRILPTEWEEWSGGDFGTDAERRVRVNETIRAILKKTRGVNSGDEGGREAEQSCSCDMDTGGDERQHVKRANESEDIDQRSYENMGLAEKIRHALGRRTRSNGGGSDPTPYHEKPVITDENGYILDDPNR